MLLFWTAFALSSSVDFLFALLAGHALSFVHRDLERAYELCAALTTKCVEYKAQPCAEPALPGSFPPMLVVDLPHELLGEIFWFCSSVWPDAPLTLSLVSRLFFGVVQSTPCVWTNLVISPSSKDEEKRCGRKAEQWFVRSGARSLHVAVDITSLYPLMNVMGNKSGYRLPVPLLWVLKRQAKRIASLALCAPTHRAAHRFLSAIYGVDIPSGADRYLRYLTLDITREPRGATGAASHVQSPNSLAPSYFPFLTELHITGHALPYLRTVDVGQLKVLVVTGPLRASPLHPDLVLGILQRATVLCRLELTSRLLDDDTLHHHSTQSHEVSASSQRGSGPIKGTLITFRNLTTLSLKTNNVPSFLARLVLPELQTLRIEDLDGRRVSAANETGIAFRQLLMRKEGTVGAGLKELDIVGIGLRSTTVKNQKVAEAKEVSHWTWCFRNLKSLQRLQAKDVDIGALFDLLSNKAGATGEVVCPRLETVVCIVDTHVAPSLLTDFQTRRPHVALIVKGSHTVSRLREHATTNAANALLGMIEKNEIMFGGNDRVAEGHQVGGLGGFGFGSSFDRSSRMGFTIDRGAG